jgi:ATP-dependent Lhr-like helicase
MQKHSAELGISDIQSEGCVYITFKARSEAGGRFTEALRDIIEREGIDTESLVRDSECPIFDKYDDYIPAELLRTAYAKDRLSGDEVIERFT